jgi:hypothetical protein
MASDNEMRRLIRAFKREREMRRSRANSYLLALAKLGLASSALFSFAFMPAIQEAGIGDENDHVVKYYLSTDLTDAITLLQNDIDSGKVQLEYEPERGYLESVLKHLNVPVNSQTLAFSKTSSQSDFTSPRTPRAMYFSDDVYIAWAHSDGLLDLIAVDPKKGPIFFSLKQKAAEKPRFERDNSCMNCHFRTETLNVPGLVIRSVFANEKGRAMSQRNTFIAGHNNPLKERWGGWYVTGTHGQDTHMGNAFLKLEDKENLKLEPTSNIIDLSDKIDVKNYLSPGSDSVALMILDDAVRMENMITRAKFVAMHVEKDPPFHNERPKSREDRIRQVGEPLLIYMLFRDEAPLKGPIKGTTNFETEFQKSGPRDGKGRSLRELDLKSRLFKYPCNYKIYSPAFNAMPKTMKDYIWKRLDEILAGRDQSRWFKDMSAEDRNNLREILLDTKPEFKAWIEMNTGRVGDTSRSLLIQSAQ